MKNFIKSYFKCTQREARGNLVAFLFLLGSIGYSWYKDITYVSPFETDEELIVILDSFITSKSEGHEIAASLEKPEPTIVLSPFDPNTASAEALKTLGFDVKQQRQILAYRKAGGRFFKPEDLKKIYAINEEHYANWEPYISIPKSKTTYTVRKNDLPEKKNKELNQPKEIPITNLNLADSLELISLPGIGPFYASRILMFRDKLGGFYSANQLDEVYGLKPEVTEKLKPYLMVEGAVSKLDINQLDFEELKRHPYIDGKMAGRILRHIKHNGPLNEKELLEMKGIDSVKVQKLLPYLQWEPSQLAQ